MKTQQPVRASRHIFAFSLAIAAGLAMAGSHAQAVEIKRAEPMVISAKRVTGTETTSVVRRAEPMVIAASRTELPTARAELRRAEPMTIVAQRPADGAQMAASRASAGSRRAG